MGLGDLADLRQTLVHDTPERFDCLGPVIKEVFEESRIVKRGWIGVPLAIVAVAAHPVARFARVEHLEWAGRIQIRSAFVIQDSKVIAFDPYDDVRLPGCEISIPWISTSQYDGHGRLTRFRFSSTFPIPVCSYQ
jgi:hypothetical protein